MSGLLIDDFGKVWPARPATLANRFRNLRLRHDFVLQGIALGFIFVRFCGSGARIALRPQLASRLAISGLFDIVGQRQPARVALAHDARLSSWELMIGTDRAIARVRQLVAETRDPSPRPLLTAKHLRSERYLDIAGGRMLPVFEAWQQRRGLWEPDLYGQLQGCGLLAGTVIAHQPHGSERLVIEHWGAKLTTYGNDWIRVARGRDYDDQPNTEFGRWCGAMLRQTIAEGEPRLTASDVVLRAIEGELVRLTFYRADLPWRTCDGAAIVTAITAQRRRVILERGIW